MKPFRYSIKKKLIAILLL